MLILTICSFLGQEIGRNVDKSSGSYMLGIDKIAFSYMLKMEIDGGGEGRVHDEFRRLSAEDSRSFGFHISCYTVTLWYNLFMWA
jgi:hypothetical protein